MNSFLVPVLLVCLISSSFALERELNSRSRSVGGMPNHRVPDFKVPRVPRMPVKGYDEFEELCVDLIDTSKLYLSSQENLAIVVDVAEYVCNLFHNYVRDMCLDYVDHSLESDLIHYIDAINSSAVCDAIENDIWNFSVDNPIFGRAFANTNVSPSHSACIQTVSGFIKSDGTQIHELVSRAVDVICSGAPFAQFQIGAWSDRHTGS